MIRALATIILALAPLPPSSQQPPAAPVAPVTPAAPLAQLSTEALAADLDFLLRKIETTHPDFTHAHPREDWERTAAAIRARLPELDVNGFAIETLRLFRLLEDGHSDLFVPQTPLVKRTWPVVMRAYADGVFVTAAAPALAEGVGGRVTALGDRPLELVLREADAFTWGDNAETRRRNALRLLSLVDLHRALSLTSAAPGSSERGSITVALADGTERRLELEPGSFLAPDGSVPAGWAVARMPDGVEPPVSTRQPRRSYWFEAVEDGGTVYFQWNAVRDDPGETFAQFCARLFRYVEEAEADRLIIDLRQNSGGNNYLNQPLIHHLIRCDRVNRPGRLLVLASPVTFSAAVSAASDLERETQALFIGEPTGAGANHYGDAELLELPRTKLPFFCSTLHWQKSDPRDVRRSILPDVPVPATFADFRAGRDAALEAALALDPAEHESAPVLAPIGRWRRPSQSARWPPAR